MPDRIESIYNNYVNGNRRDMVSQIDLYGQYDFWPEFKNWLREYDSNWGITYISMHTSYCKIKENN